MTPRARVVRAEGASAAKPLWSAEPSDPQRRRIAREEVLARLEAARLLETARAEAAQLVAAAVRSAQGEADAQLVARWVALRQAEQRRWADQSPRVVTLAVALAERLLASSLELDPSRIRALAKGVIAESGGVRRALIEAHPLDAEALAAQLTRAPLDAASVEVRPNAALARGELRLHTDVGTIDARLAPRFERLAAALRDALG
jgi:flagellar biosynthesis/type III secretory pathway protein FliH